MKTIIATAILATAAFALGIEVDVPQGGGRLPTIAMIECLAQASGRSEGEYCRTTYECSDGENRVEGVLVEGMTYYNGRRVTLATDPIATLRSCTINVQDDARVSFFSAYSPSGGGGELVGLSRIEPFTATETAGGGIGTSSRQAMHKSLVVGENTGSRVGIWVAITSPHATVTSARRQATELCEEHAVSNCRIVITYGGPPRKCVGVALSRANPDAWGWGLGATHELSRETAMASCGDHAESCYVWSSSCVPE